MLPMTSALAGSPVPSNGTISAGWLAVNGTRRRERSARSGAHGGAEHPTDQRLTGERGHTLLVERPQGGIVARVDGGDLLPEPLLGLEPARLLGHRHLGEARLRQARGEVGAAQPHW